ncbi:unnamed protein product [Amoebophrya sp. A120]|nr:unnamed protein product [Amoebophrya sp. A120]|eukprot:GSA120T00000025001.1
MSQLFYPSNVIASWKSQERLRTRSSEEASRHLRQSGSQFVRKTPRTMLDRTVRGHALVTAAALFLFTAHRQHGIAQAVTNCAAVSDGATGFFWDDASCNTALHPDEGVVNDEATCINTKDDTSPGDCGHAGTCCRVVTQLCGSFTSCPVNSNPIMVTSSYPPALDSKLVDDCTDVSSDTTFCTQELCCTAAGVSQDSSDTSCGAFCGELKDANGVAIGVSTHATLSQKLCKRWTLNQGYWCSMQHCRCECNAGAGYHLVTDNGLYSVARDLRTDCIKPTCLKHGGALDGSEATANSFCTGSSYSPKDSLSTIECQNSRCTEEECCKPRTCGNTDGGNAVYSPCPSGSALRAGPANFKCGNDGYGDPCDQNRCCVALEPLCSGVDEQSVCGAGESLIMVHPWDFGAVYKSFVDCSVEEDIRLTLCNANPSKPYTYTTASPYGKLVGCSSAAIDSLCRADKCCMSSAGDDTTTCSNFCAGLTGFSNSEADHADMICKDRYGGWCSVQNCRCECDTSAGLYKVKDGGYSVDPHPRLATDCEAVVQTCATQVADNLCTSKNYLRKDNPELIKCAEDACTERECCKPTCTNNQVVDGGDPDLALYDCTSANKVAKYLNGDLMACTNIDDSTHSCVANNPTNNNLCCMEQTCDSHTIRVDGTTLTYDDFPCPIHPIATSLKTATPPPITCASANGGCDAATFCDGPTVCSDHECTSVGKVVSQGSWDKNCALADAAGTNQDCETTCCTSTTCASDASLCDAQGFDLYPREDAASIGCDDGGCTRALCCRGAYCGACPHGFEGACTSDLIGLPNCQSCYDGYHRVATPGHAGSYSCHPNVCLCSYGTPDTGTDCVTDSVLTSCKLGSCYAGYNMVINANNRRECVPNELCKNGFDAESEVQCPAGTSVVAGPAAELLRCTAAVCTLADDAATCCVSDLTTSCAAAAAKDEITCPDLNGAARVIDFSAVCGGATCTPSECCVTAPMCATLTCPDAKSLSRGADVSCARVSGCEVPECCVVASEPFRSVTTLSMDLPADADYTDEELLDTLGPSVKSGLEQSILAGAPAGSVVEVEIISITFENSRRRTQLEDPRSERRAMEGAIAGDGDAVESATTKRENTRDKRRRASASTTTSDVLVDFTVTGGQSESGEDLPVQELVTSLGAADLQAAIGDAIEANAATLPAGVGVADVVSAPAPQSETRTPASGNAPSTTRTTGTNADEDEETIVLIFVLVGAVLLVTFLFAMAVWRHKKQEEATQYWEAYNRDGSWGTKSGGNEMWKGKKNYHDGKSVDGGAAPWEQFEVEDTQGYNKYEHEAADRYYGHGGDDHYDDTGASDPYYANSYNYKRATDQPGGSTTLGSPESKRESGSGKSSQKTYILRNKDASSDFVQVVVADTQRAVKIFNDAVVDGEPEQFGTTADGDPRMKAKLQEAWSYSDHSSLAGRTVLVKYKHVVESGTNQTVLVTPSPARPKVPSGPVLVKGATKSSPSSLLGGKKGGGSTAKSMPSTKGSLLAGGKMGKGSGAGGKSRSGSAGAAAARKGSY